MAYKFKLTKKQEIRWGKPIRNDYYHLCFQLFSRGAVSMGVEMRKIEVEEENPFKYLVFLWWLSCNVKKGRVIVSESNMLPFRCKNKKSAKRIFKRFSEVIPEARKDWLKLQQKFLIPKGLAYDPNYDPKAQQNQHRRHN